MVKKWVFFHVFFLGNIGQENVFYNILEKKEASGQAIKTTGLKSHKSEIFAKGLTHSFGQKMAIFPGLFSGNIGQENVFYNLLEQKNAFLACKNNKFKKSKN